MGNKKKTTQVRRDDRAAEAGSAKPSAAADPRKAVPGGSFLVFRETLESIVVAFVLAFLFRTFEAEAFVIPTGSMSPSLMGQHKDVHCDQCGFAFRTTASSEGEDRDKQIAMLKAIPKELKAVERDFERLRATGQGESNEAYKVLGRRNYLRDRLTDLPTEIANTEVVGGMCPMCRHLMPMTPNLPSNTRGEVDASDAENQPSYPGDRILVNKYGFDFSGPERWDVVVFKFPGDGNMNYIKRLVGLPGEVVRIFQGDLFTKPLDAAEVEFKLEHRPADKVEAMLQLVHDTDYEPSTLFNAGWPLRWAATTNDGWKVDAKPGEQVVEQRYTIDAKPESGEAWLRYRHLPPDEDDWRIARLYPDEQKFTEEMRRDDFEGTREQWRERWSEQIPPQLIVDFNAYNARLLRKYAESHGWRIEPHIGQDSGSLGTEWVGDLAVECDVEVEEARGELLLDVVEAGYHFQAAINLADGKAVYSIIDGRTGEKLDFEATRQTDVTGPGEYTLRFANVDDQLLLWVDGKLVEGGAATYDPDAIFPDGRKGMLPWASEVQSEDQGDLAPAGVAARGARLAVNRLAVLRDIYYIATKAGESPSHLIDYDAPQLTAQKLFTQPGNWGHFATRRSVDFPIEEGQLLVFGDNSPESKDARLWMMAGPSGDHPGGPYLDRRLLIGKAVYVFWPHSWGRIPGLPMLPGWPNFGDMRLVR